MKDHEKVRKGAVSAIVHYYEVADREAEGLDRTNVRLFERLLS